MSPEDLLKMLDLGGAESVPPGESAIRCDAPVPVSPHATAIELDDWGLRRGRQLVAESER